MKKKFFAGLLIAAMCLVLVGCGAKNDNLVLISELFNNCETVKTYKEYGYEMKASVKGDKLIVSTKNDKEKTKVTFNLNGNVLGNEKLSLDDLVTALIVVDSIGQFQGYKDGELVENLNAFSDEVANYTIKDEGFEMVDNGETTSIKIDITKKVPLIDMSNLYLKPDTFDMIEELVTEESTGNQSGVLAKLAYDVQVSEDYNYIYIGERDELTNSAYKSILSALEVMYGSTIANKFETLYPSFKDGKTTVGAFTIETDYQMDDEENSLFEGKKIVLVTIDNSVVK